MRTHPGPCRAQVERNVYDTLTESILLIPAGSRVICAYNAGVQQGDTRLMMVFPRIIFPSTGSVTLGPMPGADTGGAIGAEADVDSHFWKIFGSSFLIAIVAREAENSQQSGVTVNVGGSAGAGGAAAQALAQTSQKALDRNINISPTLNLKKGARLKVVVTRDLLLDPAVTGVGSAQ